jgi:hypothetical protein
LIRLRGNGGSDIEALSDYWSHGRRSVTVFLRHLAQEPGGGDIDVMYLLPPLPRSLINTYPGDDGRSYDCMWTSFNFFNTEPDDRFLDGAFQQAEFSKRYRLIPLAELRLGDLLLFGTSSTQITHASVFIADDIVFTKNGRSRMRPWKLTTIAELQARYFRAPCLFGARRVDPESASAQ